VGREDKRLVVGTLCGVALTLAVDFLLARHLEPNEGLSLWSKELAHSYWPHLWHLLPRTIQVLGTFVTAYGFLYAYGRALYGDHWISAFRKNLWAKIAGKPRPVARLDAQLTGRGRLDAKVIDSHVDFRLDTHKPIDAQLEQLAENLRRQRREIAQLKSEIFGLQKLIEKASSDASGLASQTLANAMAEIDKLRDRLNKTRVVDLRIAIAGLVISACGLVLGYWA
jgi:hypothetical protein